MDSVAGVHVNPADLGGHPLLVPTVRAPVAQRLGVRLPLGAFFERATVAALAERAATA
ncbi:hypothetical protein FHX82_002603 [Amycolatopsis bartoniae]|uniref:phosphopantetheine-binding protein n=1 Tax=Amycolatopsis bartoniae TaxID=941986 RepID=UPI0016060F33|nr:phosphopantetheine-binding protein [Amycolatopsis bartoniae]MBB2935549.1 hypothetical protein [Amycolatopsis bartoniae]